VVLIPKTGEFFGLLLAVVVAVLVSALCLRCAGEIDGTRIYEKWGQKINKYEPKAKPSYQFTLSKAELRQLE